MAAYKTTRQKSAAIRERHKEYRRLRHHTQRLSSKQKDRTYKGLFLFGEILDKHTLADMLYDLLELEDRRNSTHSPTAARIVKVIFDCIAEELRKGNTVTLPHIGRMYVVTVVEHHSMPINNKLSNIFERRAVKKIRLKLTPNMRHALVLDEFN